MRKYPEYNTPFTNKCFSLTKHLYDIIFSWKRQLDNIRTDLYLPKPGVEKSMDDYIQYIKDLADKKQDALFFNTGALHASFVMSTIFDSSKETIKIFAGNLCGQVSDTETYRTSLNHFLSKNGKLQVLLQESKMITSAEPPIFDMLKFYNIVKFGNVEVKKLKGSMLGLEGDMHFTVGDNKMYRLEYDVESFKAEGNFNNPIESGRLSTIFDDAFNGKNASLISLSI